MHQESYCPRKETATWNSFPTSSSSLACSLQSHLQTSPAASIPPCIHNSETTTKYEHNNKHTNRMWVRSTYCGQASIGGQSTQNVSRSLSLQLIPHQAENSQSVISAQRLSYGTQMGAASSEENTQEFTHNIHIYPPTAAAHIPRKRAPSAVILL